MINIYETVWGGTTRLQTFDCDQCGDILTANIPDGSYHIDTGTQDRVGAILLIFLTDLYYHVIKICLPKQIYTLNGIISVILFDQSVNLINRLTIFVSASVFVVEWIC